MYIDAHTHLNSPKLFEDWQKHILDFEKIWGVGIVNVWADQAYNNNAIEISKNYKWKINVWATIWFHPYEVECGNINEWNIKNYINELKSSYNENKKCIVAIWEAWIDISFNKEKSNINLQKKLFEAQCKLAQELNMPIIIHSRDDFESTFDVLKKYKNLKIYFHCRWYGPNEVKTLQKSFDNIWIGFCANISYPKAQNIRNSIKVCDLNNILLETDAPYLPPQEFRGKTNYPIFVKHIYDLWSELLCIEKDKLEEIVYNNFKKLYNL